MFARSFRWWQHKYVVWLSRIRVLIARAIIRMTPGVILLTLEEFNSLLNSCISQLADALRSQARRYIQAAVSNVYAFDKRSYVTKRWWDSRASKVEYKKVKRRQAADRMSGRTRVAYGKYEFNVSSTIRYRPPSFPGIVFYPSSWRSRATCVTARPKYRSPHPGRIIIDATR